MRRQTLRGARRGGGRTLNSFGWSTARNHLQVPGDRKSIHLKDVLPKYAQYSIVKCGKCKKRFWQIRQRIKFQSCKICSGIKGFEVEDNRLTKEENKKLDEWYKLVGIKIS